MKAVKFFFTGLPGVGGLIRWEFHLWILMGLLLAKAVAGGLESVGRLLVVEGRSVPGYIQAAGPFSDAVFWPTALLFLYLFAAVVPGRTVRGKDRPQGDGTRVRGERPVVPHTSEP